MQNSKPTDFRYVGKLFTAAEISRAANVPQSALQRGIAAGEVTPNATAGRFALFDPSRVGEIARQFAPAEVKAAFLKTLATDAEANAEYAALDARERARCWEHFVTRGSSEPFKTIEQLKGELSEISDPALRAKFIREHLLKPTR